MTGRITTHVLDTARGTAGAGMRVSLRRISPTSVSHVEITLDLNGRAELIGPEQLVAGLYELLFEVGEYFGNSAGFLDQVPVRFRVADTAVHYHIPLIVSPFGYSTYRGR